MSRIFFDNDAQSLVKCITGFSVSYNIIIRANTVILFAYVFYTFRVYWKICMACIIAFSLAYGYVDQESPNRPFHLTGN